MSLPHRIPLPPRRRVTAATRQRDTGPWAQAHAQPQRGNRPLLLKIPEAALELGIGLTKMYELLRSGEIRRVRVGPNATRIPFAEIEAFIARKLG